jgi:hypothetical protein
MLCCCLLALVHVAAASPATDPCALPPDLQREVASKYPGATIVNLSDLGEDDRGFFEKDHKGACPGMVSVDFYGDGKPTIALVLSKKNGLKEITELIVARRVADGWKMTSLETGNSSPYAPVLWTEPPGVYRDVYGKKTIHAARPVIIFCKYEAWAIVYSWTGDRATKIWIMD